MSRQELPKKIVLVGIMGSGKSSVGRALAEHAGYEFVDLDTEVEKLAGATIPEIFSEHGEGRFRELEAEATSRLDDAANTVLATGGGWMARPELRDRWPEAVRVWLRVTPEEAWTRLSNDPARRPLLAGDRPQKSLERLMSRRTGSYELAEISIAAAGSSPKEIAELIMELLRITPDGDPSSPAAAGS